MRAVTHPAPTIGRAVQVAISKRLRYEVLRRDNYTCRYCGAFAPVVVLEVDHVVPRARGGKDELANLVTACHDCNLGKSAAEPEDWLIEEVAQAANAWLGVPTALADEDDLFEMAVFQDRYHELEALPSDAVLNLIGKAFIAAMPYRPTFSELIRCAGMLARDSQDEGA